MGEIDSLVGAQAVLENVGMAAFAVDASYRYLAFNSAHAAAMRAQFHVEIRVGSSFPADIHLPGDGHLARALIERALAGERVESGAWFGPTGYRSRRITTCTPIRANGDVVGAAVVTHDATRRAVSEMNLRAQHRAVLNAISAPIYVLDRDLRYLEYNVPHAEGMLEQWHADIAVGDYLLGYITDDEQRAALEATYARVLAGETVYEHGWFGVEQPRHWTMTTAPLMEDGQVVGIISTALETTAQATSIEQLEEMATHDALTGLLNRPALERQMGLAIKLAERGPESVFVMLDVDDFKAFNDTRGHSFGDRVLVAVANALSDAVRGADIVGRYGGDEFGIILVNWSDGDLEAERARLSEAIRLAGMELACEIRCSMGFARITGDAEVQRVIEEADDAMYRDKRAHAAGA